jgi:hypothetical protein
MTMRDDERTFPRPNDQDRVVVSAGVPTDRVRWGPILAGVFAALTAFAVLNVLGAAIGLSAADHVDDPRKYAVGAGIWGILTLLLSFGFGGWIAGRASAVRGGDNGLLNGFMVAAVGIPVLLFVMGSASAMAARAAIDYSRDTVSSRTAMTDGDARQASAVMGDARNPRGVNADIGTNATANDADRDDARRAAKRAAWGTLLGLILAIGAASFAGLGGAKDDLVRHDDRRSDRGDTIVAR